MSDARPTAPAAGAATPPSLDDIRKAQKTIAGAAIRTPLVRLEAEDSPLAEIWLKLENLQPIGSFKIRGAANALRQAPRDAIARGVLTASAGNMAQGLAYCARELGVPCTVIVPDTAPETKLRAVERLGGRIVKAPFDRWWQTFQDRAFPGIDGLFVHAFDDDLVIAGNGTIGLEILEDLPDVDSIVAPWGGGGLACGIAASVKALKKHCRVFAAEIACAAPLSAALASGSPRSIEYRPSFVDGIGGKTVFPRMWELAKGAALIDGAIAVSVEDAAAAVRRLAERARVVAEGAAACALAAALTGRAGRRKVACIISGGNIEAWKLATILQGGLPD